MAEATGLRNNALPYPVYGAPFGVVFPIHDNDGDLVTGAAGLDSEISKNGDTAADCTNEATEIATSTGHYYLLLTATEMTADVVSIRVKTSTSDAKTTSLILYPRKLVAIRSGTAAGGASGSITLDGSASAVDDFYNGCLVVGVLDSNTEARIITDYVGSTKVASVTPNWNTTPDSDDTFTIYLPEGVQLNQANVTHWNQLATVALPLVPTTAGRTLDVSAGGEAGVDWANVGSPTTSQTLSGTTVGTATAVTTLNGIAANVITATAINNDAITAAKIAAGAIDAATFAADVDAEILSYLVDDAARIDASALNTLSSHDPGETIMGATDLGTGAGLTSLATSAELAKVPKSDGTVVWNATAAAQLQSEAADALAAYDPPTHTELVSALSALENLSQAQAQAAAAAALQAIHLDHLLAQPYDAESKPGDADALLNAVVESDDASPSLPRFTAGALEEAPTGGSAPTAGEIADAVWDEGTAGHTTGGTFGAQAKTVLDARASQTSVDDLPTNAELTSALAGSDDAVLAAIAALENLSQADVIAAILDEADTIETGLTVRGALRLALAALAGKLSGANTTTSTFRNVGDTKNRIVATTDATGRTAVTTDAS